MSEKTIDTASIHNGARVACQTIAAVMADEDMSEEMRQEFVEVFKVFAKRYLRICEAQRCAFLFAPGRKIT